MEYSEKDLMYLEQIAKIKWHRRFRCKRIVNGKICNHKEAYENKKSYFRRCKKCDFLETLTANTAFHNLRMPISTAIEILLSLQDNYIQILVHDDKEIDNPDITSARMQLSVLALRHNVTAKAIGLFLKRIGQWLPKAKQSCPNFWLYGLKSKESRRSYESIFELLNTNDIRNPKIPLENILYQLIFRQKGGGSNYLRDRNNFQSRTENYWDKLGWN